MQGHRGPVAHISLDSSQTLMATASVDKSVKVWDIEGGYCTHSFSGHRYAHELLGGARQMHDLRSLIEP